MYNFTFQLKAHGIPVLAKRDPTVRLLVQKVLALQYLPAEHIPEVLQAIRKKDKGPMGKFLDYVEDTWVKEQYHQANPLVLIPPLHQEQQRH